MLTLNLLPEKQKKDLGYVIDRRIITVLGMWLSASGIIFGVLTIPAYFFIAFQGREIERAQTFEEAAESAPKAKEFEGKIREVNNLLVVINTREEKKKEIASFILDVLGRAPDGLLISSIAYNAATRQTTIAGSAATRDAFIDFTAGLKKSAAVKGVTSPIANIIKEKDVHFSLTLDTQL